MTEANVAVLIDYENVGLDSIQGLLDQLSDVGRIIIKRAYADWSAQRSKRDQLLELGIEAIHHFRSTQSGKNSSDIRLAIDAVDLLHGAPIDTFVIVSSDSDFVPLVSKLRAAGKGVIAAGRHDAASQTLVKSCDRYIYLDDDRPSRRGRPARSLASTNVAPAPQVSLVARALEASMDDLGQVLGSKLYQTMQRIDPSFSFKVLGHRTFRQFLTSSTEVKVTRPRDASDVIVELAGDRAPEPPAPAAIMAPAPATVMAPAPAADAATLDPDWEREVDDIWSSRQTAQMSGRSAAAAAARALGETKLRGSMFPSLDKLLAASAFLRSRWRREGNTIIKHEQ